MLSPDRLYRLWTPGVYTATLKGLILKSCKSDLVFPQSQVYRVVSCCIFLHIRGGDRYVLWMTSILILWLIRHPIRDL
ncbi:hypothetical protein L1987_60124 [Smallanthus sonchifolius]|uniref:Uncharacterized protein n=1 Tax=Smallanthus sonchifolius TaxID=185202 RepID=A0ACB9D7A3_9ASTR|nr:hypothetical protein L1987_60124 [Smallanthus sonchifolius]